MRALAYLTVPTLYVIFAFAAMLAGVWGLLSVPMTMSFDRLSRITVAMDRLAAAMLGWDGRSTISKECGGDDCRFCRVLCRVLNYVLQKDHCSVVDS